MIIQKIFDFYSQYLWSIHRLFVTCLAKRCKKCALSSRHISLDDNGLCFHCKSSQQAKSLPELNINLNSHFHQYINELNSNNGKYHALILLSGGKDSAYILHRLQKEYPWLRVLCLMVDNGFTSPVALENARHLAEKCKVELMIYRDEVERFKQSFKQAFKDLEGKTAYGHIDYTDGCMIFECGYSLAEKLSIPYVISGLSWAQIEHIGKEKDIFSKEHQKRKLTEIYPLAAWRTGEDKVREYVVKNNLIPKGNEKPVLTNNKLILPMCVLDIINLGYCSFEPEFAQLIREGKAKYEEWRNTFELLEYGVHSGRLIKEANKTLKELELSIEELTREAS